MPGCSGFTPIYHPVNIKKTIFLNLPLVAETVTEKIVNVLQKNQMKTDRNNYFVVVKIKLTIKGDDIVFFECRFRERKII